MTAIKNRYDVLTLFDVKYGNPNGDPDMDGMPRQNSDTGHGFITDVCIKSKIRRMIEIMKEGADGYRIFIKHGASLQSHCDKALEANGATEKTAKTAKKNDAEFENKVLDFMCQNYYDIRAFGAVLTTFTKNDLNCGQVRGPVQFGFARSVDPITIQEVTITRSALSTDAEAEDKNNTMGHKYITPYGLYRLEGYISSYLARKTTGFSEEDLEVLWQAILNMFEHDRAAGRGNMAVRKLIIFKHDSELGNAPSHKLFDLVKVTRKDPDKEACDYSDYEVTIDRDNLPKGVTCIEM